MKPDSHGGSRADRNLPMGPAPGSAFVLCPVPWYGAATGSLLPAIYQLAYDLACRQVERKSVFERELFAVWN